jgi:PAS domain S-box-containing protein
MKDQIHNVDQVRQNLLDASLDVICAIDVHGRFITLNAASKAVWGYIPEELMGKRYIDYVVKKDIPLTDKAASEVMAGIEMTGFENSYVCKDGGIKPIIWSARWDKEAEIMYCVAKDATKIKINEKRLHRAYQLASIAWWEFDMATQTFTTSDEFYEIYGQAIPPNNQIKSEVLFSFVHPEDLPQVYIDMTSIGESNHINYEHRIIKPSGELAYLIHFTQVVRDSKGIPIALHGTTKDISIRKLQQLKIEESERSALHHSKRLSEILESIGDGFFTLDNDCKVTYWNAKAEMMLHKKREDILGKNIWEVYPETVHQKFYSEYHRAIQQNTPVHFEERNSKQIWYEVAAYPFIGGITVYFKDITQKKADENNVKRLSLVAEQTDNVVILTDAEQNITWVNRAFTQISEYSFDEALGKNPGQFLQGINTSSKTKAYLKQQIQNGEPFNCEIINYSKSGKEYWMHMKGQPIKNAEGKVEQFFAIQTDITERIELQKAIIDEKIAAQKEVSKAIISTQEKERSEIGQELHDNVNQILATIKLYIENIKSFPDHSKAFIDKSIALTQEPLMKFVI